MDFKINNTMDELACIYLLEQNIELNWKKLQFRVGRFLVKELCAEETEFEQMFEPVMFDFLTYVISHEHVHNVLFREIDSETSTKFDNIKSPLFWCEYAEDLETFKFNTNNKEISNGINDDKELYTSKKKTEDYHSTQGDNQRENMENVPIEKQNLVEDDT